MRNLFLILLSFILYPFVVRSQNGSSSSPFTALGQARNVTAAGYYYFNINGTAFNSYVDNNGFVQVAIDYGNGSGSLPQTTSLGSARGILPPAVLAQLTSASEVCITSSTGAINVITTNATLLNRITTNTTLHQGTADNSINSSWTGTGSAAFTGSASCTTTNGTQLNDNIFHSCGNTNGFHWQPIVGTQREVFSAGEVANGTYFRLMVRAAFVALPIKLVEINAISSGDEVRLNWTSENEVDLQEYEIQQSLSSVDFRKIGNILPTSDAGNRKSYFFVHHPLSGKSYYRLKMIDRDGEFEYSKIVSIDFSSSKNHILLYPNPVKDILKINVVSSSTSLSSQAVLYDLAGRSVYKRKLSNGSNEINLGAIPGGFYMLMVTIDNETQTYKIAK